MNFCEAIVQAAGQTPQRIALSIPRASDLYRSCDEVTYEQLLDRAAAIQSGLARKRLTCGDRVLVLATPGIELYALVIALLGAGMVPVLIDRGMNRARVMAALKASGASAAVGERSILRLWWLFAPLWRLARIALDGKAPGVSQLPDVDGGRSFQCIDLAPDHHGLITFTSGSTGQPKGADRTHNSLIEQHRAIRAHWPDRQDDLDSPCFPVLVLHNFCCGISTILPATDLAHPGQVNAPLVLEQLQQNRVSRIACAPAYLSRLVSAAQISGTTLPDVRSVVVGGSTMGQQLAYHCQSLFPKARIRIVYGSTEAEPIADIDLPELIQDWHKGEGHLVGKPADMVEVRIIPPGQPMDSASQIEACEPQACLIGEILVSGPHVLQGYVDNPEANRENKIPRQQGGVWHRTGDAGYLDEQGRIWLVGRVKDVLGTGEQTRYPYPAEKALDCLPGITRSALLSPISEGDADSILVVEGNPDSPGLKDALHHYGFQNTRIYTVDNMPVDGRHNSKIDRPALLNLIRKKVLNHV
jgi:acyl-CoA synthetase (AMP-forming)/AMP-acid ligase II